MKDNCIVLRPYCLLTKNENKKEKEFEANVVSGTRLIVNEKKWLSAVKRRARKSQSETNIHICLHLGVERKNTLR